MKSPFIFASKNRLKSFEIVCVNFYSSLFFPRKSPYFIERFIQSSYYGVTILFLRRIIMDDETNMLYFNLEPPTLDNMTDNLLTALIHCKKEIISHPKKAMKERNKQFKAE